MHKFKTHFNVNNIFILSVYRLIWLVLVIAAFTGFIFALAQQIEKLRRYPFDVVMEVKHEPNLSFPAVTICNHNFVRSVNFMYL